MSAAGKLKALVAASVPEWDEMASIRMENAERSSKADRALSRALPQIVAVVEAAERIDSQFGLDSHPAFVALRAALAALDKKL